MKKLCLLFIIILFSGMCFGQILITRNCDPKNNYAADRFAEIYNAGNTTVNLSGWTLENIQNGSVAFEWILSGDILPGETKVCARTNTENQTITPDFTAVWSGSGWNGKESDGTILKNNDTEIDNAVQNDGTGEFDNAQMKRKLTVSNPTTTYDASEWVFTSVVDAVKMIPGFHGTVWRGSATIWGTAGNWDNEAPTATSNAIIPGGLSNYPEVDNSNPSPGLCNNLTINSGAVLTIRVDRALTVNGTITNNAGNSGIVIGSSEGGNGSLISSSTADATVQRQIDAYTGAGDGWHTISSPVNTMTVAGSDFAPGDNDDLFSWDEGNCLWKNYKSHAFDFVNGQGYLVAYENDVTNNFTGTLNVADISLTNLSKCELGNGWHLLGNPFPSAIKWNDGNWNMTNIGGIAKVYDEEAGNYHDINADGTIPSTNAFFVQVSDASNAITIPAAAKVHSATNNYKNTKTGGLYESLMLTISNEENTFYDVTRVAFSADAENTFDWNYDSHKIFGQNVAPQLWTVIDGEEFSTNTLPYVAEKIILPLNFKAGVSSIYHINAEGLETFFNSSDVFLEDKKLETMINLRDQSMYSFTAQTDDAVDRFHLHFYGVNSIPNIENSNTPVIYAFNNTVNVLFKKSAKKNIKIVVINTMGQKVYSTSFTAGEHSFKLNETTGVYIVQVTYAKSVYSQKVFIK
jgi:hypothetical protein